MSAVAPIQKESRSCLLQTLLMIVAGYLIYWPALHGPWIWDDDLLVASNPDLRSLEGLWRIWFEAPSSDYWPLTWTALWIEWHLWGDQTVCYHLCSVALHISSGLLIWRLLRRLGLRRAWWGGFLFVVHPLAVESVAWISEIKNTLSLPFYLLAMDAWMDADEGKPSGFGKSVLFYLAAMLGKTSTIMLPAVLLLYSWWKHGRITKQDMKRIIPYLAIALALSLVTIYFQNYRQDDRAVDMGGLLTRSIGAGTAIFFYLGKFILPLDLLSIYPTWTLDPPSWLQVMTLPALTALVLICWGQRKGWGRHVLFGLGFFLLNLLPVIGLVKMRYMIISWVANHFMYLPMIGLIGLVVAGIEWIEERFSRALRPFLLGLAAIISGLLALIGYGDARLYGDPEVFWIFTIAHDPEAWIAYANLGQVYGQQQRYPEALAEFEEALKLNPNYGDAHYELGLTLMATGKPNEATDQFKAAMALSSSYANGYYDLGNALAMDNRMPEAIESYKKDLQANPQRAEGHYALGTALLKNNQFPEAIDQFEEALQLDPGNAAAHSNLGTLLARMGRIPEATTEFAAAVRIDPGNAEGHNNLGSALLVTGHFPEAIREYQAALGLRPDFSEAQKNLARAMAMEKGQPAK